MYKYEQTNERKKLLKLCAFLILGEKYLYVHDILSLLFLIFPILWTFLLIYDMLQQQQLFFYQFEHDKLISNNNKNKMCVC